MAFEIPFWSKKTEFCNLTPNEIINPPKRFNGECNRTIKSDLTYPIDRIQSMC